MGSKVSTFSCLACASNKTHIRGKRCRYKSRRISSSGRYRENNSQYESFLAPQYRKNRRNSRKSISSRTNKPASRFVLAGNEATTRMFTLKRIQPLSVIEIPNECPIVSVEDSSNDILKTNEQEVVNGVEILDCPEMSTISLKSSCAHILQEEKQSLGGANEADIGTPSNICRIDDVMFNCQSSISHGDITSTLTVPPNSLNSQFLSGVTPLESVGEPNREDNLNDSVFVDERPIEEYDCYLQSRYKITDPMQYTNNNNYLRPQTPPVRADTSEGPGFDSDFGVSAGVEMRIVSSDYSAGNSTVTKLKNSAIKRWITPQSVESHESFHKGLLKDSVRYCGSPQNSSVSQLLVYKNNAMNYYQLPARRRYRPATVAGPEASTLHVTMEWDPYDTDYGATHWMEYIIPGVTYPSYPLLSNEQYWV